MSVAELWMALGALGSFLLVFGYVVRQATRGQRPEPWIHVSDRYARRHFWAWFTLDAAAIAVIVLLTVAVGAAVLAAFPAPDHSRSRKVLDRAPLGGVREAQAAVSRGPRVEPGAPAWSR